MPIGASVAPNDRYMLWAEIWRNRSTTFHVSPVVEKSGPLLMIAGEKKLNHLFIQGHQGPLLMVSSKDANDKRTQATGTLTLAEPAVFVHSPYWI